MTALNLNSMSWHSVMLLGAVAVSETYGMSFGFTDPATYLVLRVWVTDHFLIVSVVLVQFDFVPALFPSIRQVPGPKVSSNKRLVVCVQMVRAM